MTSMLLMAVKLACAGKVRIAQSIYETMDSTVFGTLSQNLIRKNGTGVRDKINRSSLR